MPKCFVMLLDKGHGQLEKKAEWEANLITINRGFRKPKLLGYIPDKAKPISFHYGIRNNKIIPLWILNMATLKALTLKEIKTLKLKGNPHPESSVVDLQITEETDVDAHTKLNLLTKREFWKQVAEKIKLTKMEILIYLCAGYGIIRIIEFALMYMFTGG